MSKCWKAEQEDFSSKLDSLRIPSKEVQGHQFFNVLGRRATGNELKEKYSRIIKMDGCVDRIDTVCSTNFVRHSF